MATSKCHPSANTPSNPSDDDSWLDVSALGQVPGGQRSIGDLRDQVLGELKKIIDPDLYKDIVSLGFVKELQIDYERGKVSFTLELTTPACPVKDSFVSEAERLLYGLGWISDINISLSSRKPKGDEHFFGHENAPKNLQEVSAVLAVCSGKGGVGKSTICANLAFMLNQLGARVGLVDCDVFGPSLPTLVPVENPKVYFCTPADIYEKRRSAASGDTTHGDLKKQSLRSDEGAMIPVEYSGVKMMSYGYLRPGSDKYAAVRGPLASSVVYQMITQTMWGSLDYLLLDLPPGTGDIHLTVGQSVKITASVVVSEPHPLSLADVEKGLHMFAAMQIAPIATVENKAYMTCPDCKHSFDYWQIGKSDGEEETGDDVVDRKQKMIKLQEQFGIKITARLPFAADLALLKRRVDGKMRFPYVNFAEKDSPLYQKLKELAESIIRELAAIRYAGDRAPDIKQLSNNMLQIVIKPRPPSTTEEILLIPSRSVRLKCRCAECVDEYSGRTRLKDRLVPHDVHVLRMKQTGNYAISITWSDNHSSLISFEFLIQVAKSQGDSGSQSAACASTDTASVDW